MLFDGLAFHADDLPQLGDDLHQVTLVTHHVIDRLVGARYFVDYIGILSTFDGRCLHLQVRRRGRCSGWRGRRRVDPRQDFSLADQSATRSSFFRCLSLERHRRACIKRLR
jgi:hypothetical protein